MRIEDDWPAEIRKAYRITLTWRNLFFALALIAGYNWWHEAEERADWQYRAQVAERQFERCRDGQ